MDFIKRTWAEIDLDALDYNIKSIKSKMEPEHKVMGIVKADAYGHGDGFVARKLQAGGFDWFGVSNIEEGMSLRNEGITKPILVRRFQHRRRYEPEKRRHHKTHSGSAFPTSKKV